ncbi:hypothetical protein HDU67_006455 [Dinochytrium kinnereticum]|nr:hypothetical protein HDU67_006455 [Dinochytrium kinnereticum]
MAGSKPSSDSIAGSLESLVGGEVSKSKESTNLASGAKLGRFRSDPVGFIIRLTAESSAFYTGTGWRSYQNYIGARIFYPEYSIEIRNALMTSDRVRAVVKSLAEKRYKAIPPTVAKKGRNAKKPRMHDVENEIWTLAIKVIDGMVADMNRLSVIKFVAFTVNNILVRMYHQGIHIRESEFFELRKWAEIAEKKNMSLIFLPCHKSHVDYLVISYIFFRLGLALPHIAAGDNLNLPVVGSLLKHSGAFFIRRQWGDDSMYITIMREYIELLLQRGHNIEAFIEGTRSRIGKLLQPKFGILKIVLEAILSERVKDCIIVPMSIGYDKVIETESYVSELLGTPKEKESLMQLMNNLNILQFKWGRIDVRFAEPFYLREYVSSESTRRGVGFSPASNVDHKNLLLQTLGYQVLSSINAVSVVMPTALVGTVILTLRGRGVGRDELIRKVNQLRRTVNLKGGNVADFGGKSTTWVVDRAIQVLRDLIGQRQDLLEPVYYPVKRFELSFYRNQVIHLFINEAILSTAMYATVKAGGPVHNQRIVITPNLENDVSFISQLLKSEFIYGPGGLHENLEKTVEQMTALDVFAVEDEVGTDGLPTGRRWISLSPEERRIGRETFVNKETLKNAFIRLKEMGVIQYRKGPAPGANTSAKAENITWVALNREWYPKQPLPAIPQHFLHQKKKSAATLAAQNSSTPVSAMDDEASRRRTTVSSFAIHHNNHANTHDRIGKKSSEGDEKPQTGLMVRESDDEDEGVCPEEEQFAPWHQFMPDGRLWEMCEQIGRFRREGKNRRDTATVAIRVMRLAKLAGILVQDEGSESAVAGKSFSWGVKKGKSKL